jgi:glycosyltransferase involved in cell wall biosynthesis
MKSDIKILHVETGRSLYGGALQVKYLLEGLVGHGISNLLVCPVNAAIAGAASADAVVYETPFAGDMDFRLLGGIVRILRQERPDLVHVHSRRGADIHAGLAARFCGIPAILTRRVDNPEPAFLGERGRSLSVFAEFKYGLYRRIVAISHGIEQVLLNEGIPAAKLVCVPSAVDTRLYAPCGDGIETERAWFLQTFGLTAGHIPIGMSAQFIERKGHRYLVEAASLLVSDLPTLRFLLFGKGALEEEIKRLVQARGLQEYFIFAGFRGDLPRILPHLAMLVHPALMEGLGVSLLQAASCGVPIVACRAGGIPEVVQHGTTGLLVTPGDVNELCQAIRILVQQPEMRLKMGRAGRRLVCEGFSIERMVLGNLRVYEAVLREVRRSHPQAGP